MGERGEGACGACILFARCAGTLSNARDPTKTPDEREAGLVNRHLTTIWTTRAAAMLAGGALLFGCGNAGRPAGEAAGREQPGQSAQRLTPPDDATVERPAALAGQPNRPPVEAAPAVVAAVGDVKIDKQQLDAILYRAHGLPVLMNLLQLEMARAEAQRQGIRVTATDVQAELDRTQAKMFEKVEPEDYAAMLEQFLGQQGLTREEFMLLMEQNAVLRALAEPYVQGRVTDEMVREAFRVAHGEKVRIRHIAATNLQEIADVRRRLAEGGDFATLARQFSQNRVTGPRGGEMLPFSRQTPNLPDAFKEVAFALEVGQVSDTVQADGLYHLLKLEERIDPVGVRFEDYQAALREQLNEGLTNQVMNEFRRLFAQQALANMTITDPTLKAAYDERLAAQQRQADAEQTRQQMENEFQRMREEDAAAAKQRQEATTAPTARPAPTAPAAPAAREAPSPASLPATRPAELPTTEPTPEPTPEPTTVPALVPDLNK